MYDGTDSITQGDTCMLGETGEYHDRDKEEAQDEE